MNNYDRMHCACTKRPYFYFRSKNELPIIVANLRSPLHSVTIFCVVKQRSGIPKPWSGMYGVGVVYCDRPSNDRTAERRPIKRYATLSPKPPLSIKRSNRACVMQRLISSRLYPFLLNRTVKFTCIIISVTCVHLYYHSKHPRTFWKFRNGPSRPTTKWTGTVKKDIHGLELAGGRGRGRCSQQWTKWASLGCHSCLLRVVEQQTSEYTRFALWIFPIKSNHLFLIRHFFSRWICLLSSY